MGERRGSGSSEKDRAGGERLAWMAMAAVLASLAVAAGGCGDDAKTAKGNPTREMLNSLYFKIEQYRDVRGELPPTAADGSTAALVTALNGVQDSKLAGSIDDPFIKDGQIVDSWGRPVRYYYGGGPPNVQKRHEELNRAPILVSAGPDGQFGNEDDVLWP